MRLVFMGSSEMAVPSLEAILRCGKDEIVAVVSQPDRPAGRHRRLRPCPLKVAALNAGIPVLTPEKIGAPDSIEALAALRPELIVVVAYGQYIPSRVTELAPHRAINLHPSLLPKYRGAAPIQWAIVNGDRVTGVSIIYVEQKMDAGDIIRQAEYPIDPDDTAQTLHDKLAVFGAKQLLLAIDDIRSETVQRKPQDETAAVEVRKLVKEDGKMDWSLSAEALRNRIRGFNPWPGCYCTLPNGEILKIWAAQCEEAEGAPGEVLDDHLLVAAGEGALRLTEVQPAGKKRMSSAAFLNGHPLPSGSFLA